MGFRLYGPAVSVPAIKTGAWRSIDLLLFYLIFSLSSRFKFSSVANFQFFIIKKELTYNSMIYDYISIIRKAGRQKLDHF